jgi:hypothetical protein
MTAEELALLGYQPGQTASPALNAEQSSVTPQDLQQFYAMAGNPNIGTPNPSGLNPLPPSVDMATLNAVAALPPSDPNGFTSNQPFVGATPSGQPVVLPSGTAQVGAPGVDPSQIGSAADTSPANGQFAPGSPQDTPQQSQQSSSQAPANQNLATSLGFPQFADWARASGLPRQVMPEERKVILEKYLDQQKDFMARQDPEKILKIQKMQHEISTQGMKDQNLQAQTAESQSKVISGELAKQNAMDAVSANISELQSQRDNLQAIANHPALSSMVGLAGQYNPGFSDKERELKTYFTQIDGQKLIDGINKIKNESAVPGSPLNFRITQQEAMAVKDSVNRLKRSQSLDDYRKAITQYSSILDRAIASKQAQLARMPSVNQDLLKQFSYSPAAASGTTSSPSGAASAPATSAPVIKTIPGRGTFQSLGNGQWKQIQ